MRKVLYILGELNDSDIDWLTDSGQLLRVDDDAIIIEEGHPIQYIYLLLQGELKVCLGKSQQSIAKLQPGEIIGELSFLSSHPPSASVISQGASSLLQISRKALQAKLDWDIGFAARFYRALGVFLADRLRKTTLRMGYGIQDTLDIDKLEDELDLDVMESMSLSAKRFEYLVKKMNENN